MNSALIDCLNRRIAIRVPCEHDADRIGRDFRRLLEKS